METNARDIAKQLTAVGRLCVTSWLHVPLQHLPNPSLQDKLQALVYDSFLQPVTGIVDYAIGLEKLSANEHFFDDAQTAVSL